MGWAGDREEIAFRICAAIVVAAAFSFGAYLLLEAIRPGSGLISFSFLVILPAALAAFVCYAGDPLATRPGTFYIMVPFGLLGVAIVMSACILNEGVLCVLMLSPLWLISGLAGSWLTFILRNRVEDGRKYCGTLLALPVLLMAVEPSIPLPQETATVTRSIVVHGTADGIWPLLEGIPDVRTGEGRWNVSQDMIGVPRPLGARLVGSGMDAERLARWTGNIRFRERITEWQPGRRIGWRFIFDDTTGWRFTDRHLTPDSAYFKVMTGGYTLEPVDADHTRVSIDTTYWMRTPVNAYSALWGEFFLGDLENNLLALVKGRAEGSTGQG